MNGYGKITCAGGSRGGTEPCDHRQPVGQIHANQRRTRLRRRKKINGIKRHFLVDVLGLILFVVVHTANIQERAGAKLVLAKASQSDLPQLQTILADDGDSGKPMVDEVRDKHGWQFVSVKRTELHQFKVMPKRWVVERTIGWMNNFRGLSKHYDSKTGELKIDLASIFYMNKRLTTKPNVPKWSLKNEEKLKNINRTA